MHDLKVVVVGGGIAGLCAGIVLRETGHAVTVYERSAAIESGGHGLCMWPNGAKALNALGLEEAMRSLSPHLSAVRFRTRDGELLVDIPLEPLTATTGQRPYPIRRRALWLALRDRLGEERLVLGAECVDVGQDPERGVTATFADGRSATGDLLIGADGIRSRVRERCFGPATLRSLSWDWEGVVRREPELNPPDVFTFFVGDGRRAAMLPISDDDVYWFFDIHERDISPGMPVRDQLRGLFGEWAPEVNRLIDSIDPAHAQCLELCDLEPLRSIVSGKIALVGDAAHATSPWLGQGAAMAAEDALVLAHYLRTTSVGVEDALVRYERERRERTSRIVEGARAKGEAAMGIDADANERYYAELRAGGRDFVETVERITLEGPLR
jgi:FAD-dependent urate hydroxylase